MFEKNMDGRNVDSTIAEFGNRIYSTLLNHFKKFKISQGLGGLQLLQDLTAYWECAKTLNSPKVLEKFDILKEITTIHLVAPENLNMLLKETKLSKLPKQDFLCLVGRRSDYKSWWIEKYNIV